MGAQDKPEKKKKEVKVTQVIYCMQAGRHGMAWHGMDGWVEFCLSISELREDIEKEVGWLVGV